MAGERSDHAADVALVAATIVLVLAAQRYYRGSQSSGSHRFAGAEAGQPAALPTAEFARELAQPGRGRFAESPLRIPLAGWKDILWRTYQQIGEDRLLAIAAGVVFFGMLAIFPAITALVSFYALFADPSTIAGNLQSLSLMLPDGSFQIVQDQIGRVLSKGNLALGTTFLFGLALALWSANAGVKAVIDALNVAYGEKEKRGFFRLNLLSLAFTVGAIAAIILLVGTVVALPLALDHLWLADQSKVIISTVRWPLLLFGLLVALGVLYRFGPSRTGARWKWLGIGTLAAALLWLAGSFALSWYLSNFAHYSATYGSLGAAIGLMMWMWMSSIIVLCGAELNSEIEHQTAIDSTVGGDRPLGQRGAVTADTVGRAYA